MTPLLVIQLGSVTVFTRLLAAFILIPLFELYLLFQLADATSGLTTLAIVILTGVLGSVLARREGIRALSRFQNAAREGRIPSTEIQDGFMIIFAAALLLTPGILTDAVGFALLVPIGRAFVRKQILPRYFQRVHVSVGTPFRSQVGPEPADFSYPESDRWSGKTVDGRVVSDGE